MSFSAADIPEIKWSLGAFLFSLAAASALIYFSTGALDSAQKTQQAAQQQLNEAKTQLNNAQSDAENMTSYQLEYQALNAQKTIGNEQRLDWIEGLERLRQKQIVLDFKYNIAPQQSYAPNPALDAGNFALNISPMTLQIDLLHEEQLTRLLDAIHAEMPGWFMLNQCSLSRAESAEAGATLSAKCEGGWLTLKNRSAP
jgi:TolA-binding protein